MRLLLHPDKHKSKQEANNNIGKMTNEIARYETNVSIKRLATAIENGQAFVLATSLNNKRANNSFAQSQLVGIDIDKADSVQSVLDKCAEKGLEPCIGYYTFSQQDYASPNPANSVKPGYNFRLLFKLEEPIIRSDVYRQCVNGLITYLGGDGSCKDAMRLFYGSKSGSIFLLDKEAENDNTSLYMLAQQYTSKPKVKPIKDITNTTNSFAELSLYRKQQVGRHYLSWEKRLLSNDSRYPKLKEYICSLWSLNFMNAELAYDIINIMIDTNATIYSQYGDANWKYDYYKVTDEIIQWVSKTFD